MVRKTVENFFEVKNEEIENVKKIIGEDGGKLGHVEKLLEKWIQCSEYLPKNYDRDMARNFIRGSKFNLEITKRKLEGYFLAKFAFPEFYNERNPDLKDIKQAFDSVNIVRVPKLTENGERICIVSVENSDPATFNMLACIKLFWMLYDLTLTSTFPVTSEILIFDLSNVSSGILLKCLSPQFKNAISILRDAYASRISQLHLINCPLMAEKVVSAVRPLLHEKVRERFIVHKNLDSLLEQVHIKLLPSDFGGTLPTVRSYMKQWQTILTDNSDWFQGQDNVKIIGKPPKRVEKFTTTIGEGSFRKLSID